MTVILQNISQIASNTTSINPSSSGSSELRTIFSNSAVRVCLHNADETTARFFSDEIGKQAVIVPGLSDHFQAGGGGVFPTGWNRIHSQQVVARVDADAIKRMEKQHALVYLSPAGDPEFGEVKPLMVDLRGIEEIARLHLLHNVSSRPGGPEGTGAATPPVPTHVPWQSNLGQLGGWRQIPNQNEIPENMTTASDSSSTTAVGKLADTLAGAMPDGTNEPKNVAGMIADGASTTSAIVPKHIEDNLTHRLCPACKQPATSKKFCTNCGAFLGQPAVTIETAGGRTPSTQGQRIQLDTSAVLVNAGRSQTKQQTESSPPPFPFAKPNIQNIVQNMSAQVESNSTIDQNAFNQMNPMPGSPVNQSGKKPLTSLNPELNRPVPKSWGNQ